MKLAVSGKGGVGKTTLVAILARLIAADGRNVIAIDADPACNLSAALGVPVSSRATPIREMKALIQERTGAKSDGFGQYFKLNPTVSDLPEKFSVLHQGVRLMVLGGITKGGGGCACPENALLKALLSHLIVLRDDTVIADMEAGIEHLGRATVSAVDALLVVLEPGRRSVETAQTIQRLAGEIGLGRVLAVGNKVQSPEHREFLEKALNGVPLLGCISYDLDLARADLEGRPAYENAPRAVAEVRGIYDNLLGALGARTGARA
jgi:CO dehydrogenase maturation factor